MRSARRQSRMALILGLAVACGAGSASAQFFFQPFFQSWRYDLPAAEADDVPQYASRRAVARILAREGYTLIGPLGRRGDQIAATGVSRREGQTRFFIDPFEGRILAARRLEPAPEGRPYAEDIGRDGATQAGRRPARAGARPGATTRRAPAPASAAPETANRTPQTPSPTETPRRAEAAPPADLPKPAETARPVEPGASAANTSDASKSDAARPAATAAAQGAETRPPSQPLPSRPAPARTTGGSHRAIVPPKPAGATAIVTPPAPAAAATAPATTGASTPTGAP